MGNVRNDAPIGVFDSGIGGLTVARAIIDQLPYESITYVGDTANCPYGPRPIAHVRELALNVMDHLVSTGVKMLVIACNSASSAVLHDARERYTKQLGIPVVEVIRPAARAALHATRNNKVGVIATQATIQSGAYDDALAVVPDVNVFSAPAPRFVEFAEAGITTGDLVLKTAREYLEPIKESGVDTLVLGCTHYPFLSGVIGYVMGEGVLLVSSAEETAKDVYRALTEENLLRSSESGAPLYSFNVTGESGSFETLARRFIGPKVADVAHVDVPHLHHRCDV